MTSDNIVVIFQKVGNLPKLQKIKNDIATFEEILGRKN